MTSQEIKRDNEEEKEKEIKTEKWKKTEKDELEINFERKKFDNNF